MLIVGELLVPHEFFTATRNRYGYACVRLVIVVVVRGVEIWSEKMNRGDWAF
jgi:hypothetical protein